VGQQGLLRVYAYLILLVLLSAPMVVVVMLGGRDGTSSVGEPVPPNLKVDRIAYVGLDNRIRTISPDGSGQVLASPNDGWYTWPTWAPDGRTLAFSGVVNGGTDEPRVILYSFNTFTRRLRELHVREAGLSSLVAYNAPHYTFWSPDGTHLAFIGNTPTGLRLYLDDMLDSAGPIPVLDGAPLWMNWSPDSQRLLVHRGPDHFMVDADTGAASSIPTLSDGLGYNVPAWKPSGDEYAYVSRDGANGFALYSSGPDTGVKTLVAKVPIGASFHWSPDGKILAVTRPERVISLPQLGLQIYRRISLYREDGTRHPVEIEDAVVAYFWSPDSTKLAYVTLTSTTDVMRWNVMNVPDGTTYSLADFIPSEDQITVFQYFDQYAHSHSLWSPDSTSLVFAGRVVGEAISASQTQQPVDRITVLAVRRFTVPEVIADGFLAFWSPR
jgi:TolB protein